MSQREVVHKIAKSSSENLIIKTFINYRNNRFLYAVSKQVNQSLKANYKSLLLLFMNCYFNFRPRVQNMYFGDPDIHQGDGK